jgi:hypothetical protein
MAGVANAQMYTASLTPAQEVPQAASTAKGYGRVVIDEATLTLSYTVVFSGVTSGQTAAHIHTAGLGVNGPVMIDLGIAGGTSGTLTGTVAVTAPQVESIRANGTYINVHSASFPGGEIRGQLALRRVLDFDGDGQTDYSVLRFPNVPPPGASPITQYNLNTTTGFQAVQWGNANTDYPCPGDYDGDGQDDFCVYRAGATVGAPSHFYILHTSDNSVRVVQWGLFGDTTTSRDFDGDGITDIAIFRRGASAGAQAVWWILQSRTGTVRMLPFGLTGNGTTSFDSPAPQDYDGDGTIDVAVHRFGISPSNTYIVLRSSDSGVTFTQWGNFDSDWVTPGDFDGDGKADLTAGRTGGAASSPMVWWTHLSSSGQVRVTHFGISSDIPAPGDYDGDGRADLGVVRAAGGQTVFYALGSFDNAFMVRQWGLATDFAVIRFQVF